MVLVEDGSNYQLPKNPNMKKHVFFKLGYDATAASISINLKSNSKLLSTILFILCFTCTGFYAPNLDAQGRTYTTIADGNWNSPNVWDCSGGGCNNNPIPDNSVSNEDIIITHQLMYTDNSPINIMNNGMLEISDNGQLTMSSNINLDADGVINIDHAKLNIGPGIFNVDGNISLVNSLLTKDGNVIVNGTLTMNNSCIELLDGNFNNYGTFQGDGGVKTFSGNMNNFGTWSSAITYCSSGNTSNIPGNEDCESTEEVCKCIKTNCDIVPAYPTRFKVNELIGSELTSLNENFEPDNTPSEDIFKTQSDSVLIEIIIVEGKRDSVENLLLTEFNISSDDYIDNGDNLLIITTLFSIAELPELNVYKSILTYVRPALPAVNNFDTGLIISQGDTTQGSFLARAGFNLSGKDIRIGVLSDSYGADPLGLSIDITNKELPSGTNPVTVVKDYPGGVDEGRAMLQIIHDVAPEAELFFHTGFVSEGNFAKGIKTLDEVYNCDVILDDLIYLTEPFLKDGMVSAAITSATANGKSYFTSAGNFASRSYESTLLGNNAAHDFDGNGDELQNLTLDVGFYLIVLQWEDSFYSIGETLSGGTANDLDIYLAEDNGDLLYGFNRNNLGGDPIEIMPFEVVNATTTNIKIERAVGSTNQDLKFKYVVFRAGDDQQFDAEYIGSTPGTPAHSTIVGHANSADAMTV